METSETQSEGEEYLQPKSRVPLPPSGLSSLSSVAPSPHPMKFWPSGSHMTSDGSCAPQNHHNWTRERMRYAQEHGLDPNTLKVVSDGSSIRYCGDPIKLKDDIGSDEYDAARSQAQVGSLKLELPVDEDDYLMPSPQNSQGATAYVDLIDSKNGATTVYAEFRNHIDNPEYLMSSEPPSQTLGIPMVSSESIPVNPSRHPDGVNPPLPYYPQRSSEEESDHEYYNDVDRLRREMQPLKCKGETTV